MTKLTKLPNGWKAARRQINEQLADLSAVLHDESPLSRVIDILHQHGVLIPDWEEGVIFCGRDEHLTEPVTFGDAEVPSLLILNWYKHDSGRFEVTTYLS